MRPSTTTRDDLIDNARAVLIVLVVLGHVVMTYHDEAPGIAYLHYFIYLFHMPAFAALSGYVVSDPRRTADRAIMALLPMYLAFSTVHLVARWAFFGVWEWEVYVAPGLLWYLFALMCWRLLLPVFVQLRHPILVALALSLLAGLTSRIDTTFSLSRIIVFLPAFLIGYFIRREWIDELRSRSRVIGIGAVAVLAVAAAVVAKTKIMRLGLLAGSDPYSEIKGRTLVELGGRVAMVGFTILALIALLQLLPRRGTWATFIGTYSLGVYVLHMYYVYALERWLPTLDGPVVIAVVLLSPLPVAALLASRPARFLVQKITDGATRAVGSLLRPVEVGAQDLR